MKSLLQSCPLTVVSYRNFRFKPLSEVFLKCSFKNLHLPIKFIIVGYYADALLGLEGCLKFNLIKRLNDVCCLPDTTEGTYVQFEDIFEGLDEISEECSIEFAGNAKPVVQYQRKCPLSLYGTLKKELDNLESNTIIEKVTYSTK